MSSVRASYTSAMKMVGTQDRNEIELDPVEAYRRSRRLDMQLRGCVPQRPRGVTRATAKARASMDEAHMLLSARRVDPQ